MSGRGGAGLSSSAINTSAAWSSMIILLSKVVVAIVILLPNTIVNFKWNKSSIPQIRRIYYEFFTHKNFFHSSVQRIGKKSKV